MTTLPPDGCFGGPTCGLCFTRRCEQRMIKPLTAAHWAGLFHDRRREHASEEAEATPEEAALSPVPLQP